MTFQRQDRHDNGTIQTRIPKPGAAIYQIVTNAKGISSMKLHRNLDIRQPTAWFMLHCLREAISSLARPEAMEGPVEVDEMYMGGREKQAR